MSDGDSDRWEKRLDLNSMPDIELLDGETANHPPTMRATPAPNTAPPDLDGSDDLPPAIDETSSAHFSRSAEVEPDDVGLDVPEPGECEQDVPVAQSESDAESHGREPGGPDENDDPVAEGEEAEDGTVDHTAAAEAVGSPEPPGAPAAPIVDHDESPASDPVGAVAEDRALEGSGEVARVEERPPAVASAESRADSASEADPFSAWIGGSGERRTAEVSTPRHPIELAAAQQSAPAADPFSQHISDGSAALASELQSEPDDSSHEDGVGDTEAPIANQGDSSASGELAPVVPISAASEAATTDQPVQDDEPAAGELSEDFNELLAVMSNDELDRALEFLEKNVRPAAGADPQAGDDSDFADEMLRPLGIALSQRDDVEVTYTIEEVEDMLDIRLPDAARVSPDWWSNRPDQTDLGYAAYWRDSGWWAYPELEDTCVRFRRTL